MDQFRSLLILVDHYRSGYDSRIKYYVRQTANNRAPKPKISLPTVLRRCVWSRNIKNGCSIHIYDISRL